MATSIRAGREELASQVATLVREDSAFAWYGGVQQRAAEVRFAELTGSSHAVFCQSGTAALHLLLHAGGMGRDAIVAVPSFCFYSVIDVVLMSGARPFLLAVDPDTLLVDLDRAIAETPRHALFVAVHAAGAAFDVAELQRHRPDLVVIEDAADAQGTLLRGRPVGTLGVGASWSFTTTHNEVHSAAVGGMVTTESGDLAVRLRRLCHYGKDHRSMTAGTRLNPLPSEPGFNYMSSEVEAAVAFATMADAPGRWASRRRVGMAMDEALRAAGLRTAQSPPDCERNFYDVLFWLPERLADVRQDVLDALVQAGCPAWTYHSLFELPWLERVLNERDAWDVRARSLAVVERRTTRGLMGLRPAPTEEWGHEVVRRAVAIVTQGEGNL